jgi:dihydroxyacetone kinase-like predicted kinase
MWRGNLRRSITRRRYIKGKGNDKSKEARDKEEKQMEEEEEEEEIRLLSSFVLSCAKKTLSTSRRFNDYLARWGVSLPLPPWLWRE